MTNVFTNLVILNAFTVLRDDVTNVIKNGDSTDHFFYLLAGIFILVVFYVGLKFIFFLVSYVLAVILGIYGFTTKEARVERKAKRYERNQAELDRNEKVRLAKEAEAQKLAEEKRKAELEQRKKQLRNEELAAFADVDYSHFLPKNGYTYGPSVDQRLSLEEERIRKHDQRRLTEQEKRQVKRGLSAEGDAFGGKTYGDQFAHLWNLQQQHGHVQKSFSNLTHMKGKLPQKEQGAIIPFPNAKK